ncbi:helix-turn-helix transcriptional regulator [Streptomyces griseus]|uniref:helix-turn-helix transcriptional regulator n=1 Tax=Streptomyces griseus TaxID=1911 RepID=UPI0037FA896D
MTIKEAGRGATSPTRCSHAWVTVDQLAGELQIPKSTIYGWKYRGLGPQWVRVGKHLRARRTSVDAWLNSLDEAA